MEDLVSIHFDIWTSLLAFGVFQGIFLITILLTFSRNKSLYLLVSLVAIVVLSLSNYLLLDSRLYVVFPHWAHVAVPFLFLIGPSYFFYIKSVLTNDLKFTVKGSLHLGPFLLCIALLTPFYILDAPTKIEILSRQGALTSISFTSPLYLFIVAQIIHSLAYIIIVSSILKRAQGDKKINNKIKNKVIWLRRFNAVYISYWAVDFLSLSWYTATGVITSEIFYISILINTLVINALVFLAIRSNKMFSEILLNRRSNSYKNSTLSPASSKTYLKQIIGSIEQDRSYLDSELSLSKLSERLSISSHQVSQILNTELGKNFYEVVNEYRYREVKERLQKPEYKHLTILAIALDSGFNNKNTFNKVFKRYSGMTPSQFQKQSAKANSTVQ